MKNNITKIFHKRNICLFVAMLGIVFLLIYEVFLDGVVEQICSNQIYSSSITMIITRFVGGIIFLVMLINLEYNILNPIKKPFWRSVSFALPAFAVAINNFPFSCVINGDARIDADAFMILLLLLECMCVGFFEELAFRGVVFLGILKKKPTNKAWAFWSIILSSVVFGLIHLINLFESSPLPVLMQIGYSTLIGAMCSVVLLRTSNVWLCAVLHGMFNFAGAIVPTLGTGKIWDTFTVALTVIIAVAVFVYMIYSFINTDLAKCGFYRDRVVDEKE